MVQNLHGSKPPWFKRRSQSLRGVAVDVSLLFSQNLEIIVLFSRDLEIIVLFSRDHKIIVMNDEKNDGLSRLP